MCGKGHVLWIRATGFVLLNSLVLSALPGGIGAVFLFGYAVPQSLGLGWSAYKTKSILPGLLGLNLANLIFLISL